MRVSALVTQGGADTLGYVAIDTNLTVDGKMGWSISAIRAHWVDCAAVAAVDWTLQAKVCTVPTATLFNSADEIARVMWGVQNTAGVAVAYPVEPVKEYILLEPRLTVQPFVYVQVDSAATAQANDVVIQVYYDVIKLTDTELLRLMVGGA